jgi:hypothetical protein
VPLDREHCPVFGRDICDPDACPVAADEHFRQEPWCVTCGEHRDFSLQRIPLLGVKTEIADRVLHADDRIDLGNPRHCVGRVENVRRKGILKDNDRQVAFVGEAGKKNS